MALYPLAYQFIFSRKNWIIILEQDKDFKYENIKRLRSV